MAQLRRGARQSLDYINADLDAIDDLAYDNPEAVQRLVMKIRKRIADDIEPMLQRAAPPIEQRLEEIEKRLAELEGRTS